MSRPISTKQRMIKAAFALFHERGVHGTSVDAVLARSRTGKGQFSHYFKTKEGLVQAVLEHFYEELRRGTYDPVAAIRSWGDLERWMRSFYEWQQTVECALACPIGTIGGDLSKAQETLRAEIRRIFDWRRAFIAGFFNAQQAAGKMRRDFPPEALADFCYTITQGGLYMAKAERDSRPFEHALNVALATLRSMRIPARKARTRSSVPRRVL